MTEPLQARCDALHRALRDLDVSSAFDLRVGPCLAQADVSALERAHDVTLPTALRTIVTRLGDGVHTTGMFSIAPLTRALAASPDAHRPFPIHGDALQCSVDAIAAAGPRDSVVTKHTLPDAAWVDADDDLPGVIELCDLGCGWTAKLVVTGPVAGWVFHHGEVGWHPEVCVADGRAVPHDVISWAMALAPL